MNKNDIKVWIFYLDQSVDDKDYLLLDDDDRFYLYAITDNKVLAKQFRDDRDMKQFKEVKKKISKAEYIRFANSHASKVIKISSYESIKRHKVFNIVSTGYEEALTMDNIDNGGGVFTVDINTSFIKNEYRNALDKLGYVQLSDLNNGLNHDYDMPVLIFDEFDIFISIFGYTFK